MHLMQRQRRHIISIFVTFSRKMFLRLRLKFHPEFFGRQLPFSVFILLSTVEHDRTDVFPVLVIFLRELVFHLGLHVHPELLGGQHDVGEHDADAEFAHRMEALARKAGF